MFQNKIKNGKYRCLEDLEDDFMLMCKNAQTYNVEGSEIFEHSIVLGSIFTDIKEKFQRQFEDSIAQGSAGGAMAAGAGPPGGYDGMDNLSDSDYGEFLIAALIFSAGYYSAPIFFLQFKEFELYWGAVFFFKICSHIFMIFEVKLEQ